MNSESADPVSQTVLYEGFNLYPYRPSALKNRHRWTFGVLYPRAYCEQVRAGDAWQTQTQGLLEAKPGDTVRATARFLQLTAPSSSGPAANGQGAWRETIEREAATQPTSIESLLTTPASVTFHFWAPSGPPFDEEAGHVQEAMQLGLRGCVELSAERIDEGLYRFTCRATNRFEGENPGEWDRESALVHSMLSTHTLLATDGGAFVSLIEPAARFQDHAAACENIGAWPVLLGVAGERTRMLSAPIILYDYPAIAPESVGNFFDSTEMDEMLALRVCTLSDGEKREAAAADSPTREMLSRAEAALAGPLAGLHGAIRSGASKPNRTGPQPGDRVRLRPTAGADSFDLLLTGQTATVLSVEQDFEGRNYVTVTLDADPGSDLGAAGRPGHRFFFRVEEVERLAG